MTTNRITTHVLDTALGRPAAGVPVRLERVTGSDVHVLGSAGTDDDGRVRSLLDDSDADLEAGTYRLVFDVADYHHRTGQKGFFPEVAVTFRVEDPTQHHHVPLLLSPFAYSTYRGS